ncbi:hypothetical protein LINPERPRIM_LOCUS7989, partial [Linum perenne]
LNLLLLFVTSFSSLFNICRSRDSTEPPRWFLVTPARRRRRGGGGGIRGSPNRLSIPGIKGPSSKFLISFYHPHQYCQILISIMKRSKPNYVAPGLLNKYSKKPMSFKSFSSRSNLTKRQELLFKDSLTQVNEEPSRTPPATTDNVDIQPHVPPMSEQNRHDEIMEEINAEIIEEIDPEFNVQALEDIDLAINDDSQNEQNLNESKYN